MDETGAIAVIPGRTAQMTSLIAQIQELRRTEIVKLVDRKDFDKPSEEPYFEREDIDREAERHWIACILHSSGSTGLPKPIGQPHRRVMAFLPRAKGEVEFTTFPWFHGYGFWRGVHGMMDRKTTYMYNPNLPVTAEYVTKVVEHVRPQVLHVVPYTLELLALTNNGLEAMKSCDRVVFSGSACPDDLGNELIRKGINVETLWGAYVLPYSQHRTFKSLS